MLSIYDDGNAATRSTSCSAKSITYCDEIKGVTNDANELLGIVDGGTPAGERFVCTHESVDVSRISQKRGELVQHSLMIGTSFVQLMLHVCKLRLVAQSLGLHGFARLDAALVVDFFRRSI